MPRIMPPGLMEAIDRGARLRSHDTLELFIVTGAETRTYHFATGFLNFNGVIWKPELRETPEITFTITGEANTAAVELQNVDTLLGIEFANLQRELYGAEANVGRWWKDLDE